MKAIQRMLGHASATMTLDTYADLFENDLETIATRLAGCTCGSCGPVGHQPSEEILKD